MNQIEHQMKFNFFDYYFLFTILFTANEKIQINNSSRCSKTIWKWLAAMKRPAKKPNSGNHTSDRSKVITRSMQSTNRPNKSLPSSLISYSIGFHSHVCVPFCHCFFSQARMISVPTRRRNSHHHGDHWALMCHQFSAASMMNRAQPLRESRALDIVIFQFTVKHTATRHVQFTRITTADPVSE